MPKDLVVSRPLILNMTCHVYLKLFEVHNYLHRDIGMLKMVSFSLHDDIIEHAHDKCHVITLMINLVDH